MTEPPGPDRRELAAAERMVRALARCRSNDGLLDLFLAEYDRRGGALDRKDVECAEALTRRERDRDRANADLAAAQARIAALEAAAKAVDEAEFPTDGVIHRSSFDHVRREMAWENLRAAVRALSPEDETQ